MNAPPLAYLGGPDVFLPNAAAILAEKAIICAAFGIKANLPGDLSHCLPASASPRGTSRAIFDADVALATASDIGIFNLTPFRGVSADVGTVFELGLMFALGKPVFGYTNIATDYVQHIAPRQYVPPTERQLCVDADGCHIELFGNPDNLMITESIAQRTIEIIRYDAPLATRLVDLTAFGLCCAAVRTWLDANGGGVGASRPA